MDITFLNEYFIPVIVGICLCVGYVIKTSIPKVNNSLIPMILSILGLLINIWINSAINPSIVLGGLFSGLASTGLHQLFKNLIKVEEK
ncbi:holin [Turicibacter sanguinis]|uniref:Holin n=1 Tax=Turicibacter sanguinis TaxID=154288 RepID=A0A9X4XH56_9FIRM|nr:phage holin family protein [uncultured Turicibacter sp.]MTK22505.1 holin [Turicibacter sanguinis]MTK73759.1 holin [Turicibacter sanguinis]MTN45488.1 holin [Turicibacter sanguinis]MTN51268.1 holin [Turicibacter sanguinis]MTN54417.1 holin [Turicibacter sanguinis]